MGPRRHHRPLRPGYRNVHRSPISRPAARTAPPPATAARYLEIWNDVFMQYNKQADGTFVPLAQKNVDTGMGLERTICVLSGEKSVYEYRRASPASLPSIERAFRQDTTAERRSHHAAFRIIADHMRTATFITGRRPGA